MRRKKFKACDRVMVTSLHLGGLSLTHPAYARRVRSQIVGRVGIVSRVEGSSMYRVYFEDDLTHGYYAEWELRRA